MQIFLSRDTDISAALLLYIDARIPLLYLPKNMLDIPPLARIDLQTQTCLGQPGSSRGLLQ